MTAHLASITSLSSRQAAANPVRFVRANVMPGTPPPDAAVVLKSFVPLPRLWQSYSVVQCRVTAAPR
jgi:hypothetical protein